MNVQQLLAAASLTILAACASNPPIESRPQAPAVVAKFVGEWESTPGVFAVVTAEPSGNFHIHSNRSGTDRETVGELIDVDGVTLVQVRVFTPTKGDAANGAVPLYVFGQLNLKGDALQYTAIKADWLAQAIERRHKGTYVATGQIEPRTGVAIVGNWGEMEAILREALSDPQAMGTTEVFKRVKKK